MQLQIKNIILWPKLLDEKPVVINFSSTAINVITGYSQKGKSAIIPIIDYCLGSNKCTIPIGTIRDTTEWYGVLIDVGVSRILLARRDPGNQESTGDMYFEEALDIQIPNTVEKNSNIAAIKKRFNELAGLPALDFDIPEYATELFKEKPSFRDMAAFNFQPQWIIANPNALYFKADTFEHQQKLKTIFPLVLGFESNKTLELRHELKALEAEQEKLGKRRDEKQKFIDNWKLKLKTIYLQAYEKGLADDVPAPNINWDTQVYINKLKKIPEKLKELDSPKIPKGATERIIREITILRNEEIAIARKIENLKQDLILLEPISKSFKQDANGG